MFQYHSDCSFDSLSLSLSIWISFDMVWHIMKNLRSASFSSSPFLIFLLLSLHFKHTQAFDSVIQLPHSGSDNTRFCPKRVLSLAHFGAKGDGIHNDTKVINRSIISSFSITLFLSLSVFGLWKKNSEKWRNLGVVMHYPWFRFLNYSHFSKVLWRLCWYKMICDSSFMFSLLNLVALGDVVVEDH